MIFIECFDFEGGVPGLPAIVVRIVRRIRKRRLLETSRALHRDGVEGRGHGEHCDRGPMAQRARQVQGVRVACAVRISVLIRWCRGRREQDGADVERLQARVASIPTLALWRGADMPDAILAAPRTRRRMLGFGHDGASV